MLLEVFFLLVILYFILNNTFLHHMERNQEMPGLQSLHQVRYISVCYFHQVHTGILNFPNSQSVPHLAMDLQLILAYDQACCLLFLKIIVSFFIIIGVIFYYNIFCFPQHLKYHLYFVVHVFVLHHLNEDHESVCLCLQLWIDFFLDVLHVHVQV